MFSIRSPLTVFSAVCLTVLTFITTVPSLHFLATIVAMFSNHSYNDSFQIVISGPLNLAIATMAGVSVSLAVGKAQFEKETTWSHLLLLNPISLKVSILTLLIGFSLQFPLSELGNLSELFIPISLEYKYFVRDIMSPDSWQQAVTTVVALVIIVPVCEELLFRGFLLPGLYRAYGASWSLVLTSLLFGFSHFRIPTTVLPATIAGFLLGVVTLYTRSIWTPIVLHAAINAVPLLLPNRLIPIQGFNTIQEHVVHIRLDILGGSSLVALLLMISLLRDRSAMQ